MGFVELASPRVIYSLSPPPEKKGFVRPNEPVIFFLKVRVVDKTFQNVRKGERNRIQHDGGHPEEDELLEVGQRSFRRQRERVAESRRRVERRPQGKGQRNLATWQEDYEGRERIGRRDGGASNCHRQHRG